MWFLKLFQNSSPPGPWLKVFLLNDFLPILTYVKTNLMLKTVHM